MNRDEVIRQLKKYICEALLHNPSYPLEQDEPLITGGLIDSFALVQLSGYIEEAFDARVPDSELTIEVMDSLNAMADCVMRYMEPGKAG